MAWETTEHKKVENTIKEERDRLVSLINSIEDEIWFSNKDGVFTLKNPSAQRGFELDTKVKGVKELAGTIEVFRPDGTPRPVDEAPPLLALKGHSVRNQEEIVRLPASGELRHRQVTASPVRDADGNIIGSVSVVRDISEVKRAEMQLLETRNFLENLIDYANAPIIVWDPNFRITRFNHAFEHLTGYSAIDVLGRQLDLLFPANYKEPSIALIRRTGTGEHWESVEIPILCADGQVRTVLWNSATIFHPETNKVIATIAQGQDITDRKKAEMALAEASSYLENLIDYANAPIIVWDPDFKIIRFNRAFEHLTGMKASDVLGKDLDILFPAVSRQDTMEKIHWTSKGEHWESVETPVQRFDGSTRLVLWNSATIFSPGTDRIFATIAQGQDITARKDAERELVRSNAELEQFAYVASHDLKEPLRMISGFLELLQLRYKGKIDAEADEFIRFAIDGANRMNWLIEDLLQFSRIGRASWKLEQTSMQDAYQQAVDNLRAHIREANAEITRGELPTLFVDRLQMTTLLQNLIGNAIKFRSQARPEVEVLAKRESGGWVFSVKDNGIGFPMEYSEKIFELFERLHSKEKYPGTGIGLAICKKIVERHGGRIWAESKEGEGSTFYFFIPDKVGVTNVL